MSNFIFSVSMYIYIYKWYWPMDFKKKSNTENLSKIPTVFFNLALFLKLLQYQTGADHPTKTLAKGWKAIMKPQSPRVHRGDWGLIFKDFENKPPKTCNGLKIYRIPETNSKNTWKWMVGRFALGWPIFRGYNLMQVLVTCDDSKPQCLEFINLTDWFKLISVISIASHVR